jgi:uncharacterized RmlC-like cupin family protein
MTTDGVMLPPGAGRVIAGGGLYATLKVPGGPGALTSTFEIVIPAGYDVGAHVHSKGEELFYVVNGELDLLAFEPVVRSPGDWHDWTSRSGQRFIHGGRGSLLFVPAGCPHAFANPSDRPAVVLFQSAPSGHEDYFEELAALLRAASGAPDELAIADLRSRYDIQQLTTLRNRRADQTLSRANRSA